MAFTMVPISVFKDTCFPFVMSQDSIDITHSVIQWYRKFMWERHVASSPSDRPFVKRKKVTLSYPFPFDEPDLIYANGIICSTWEHFQKAFHHFKYVQTPALVTYAPSHLKRAPWKASPTDKDGGYALIHRDDIQTMHAKMMGSGDYSMACIGEDDEPLLIMHLCDQVCKAGQTLHCQFVSPCQGQQLFCAIQYTVKTHKGVGEVVPRVLHASPTHISTHAMQYVRNMLKPFIYSLSHVLKDSAQLVAALHNVLILPSDRIVKRGIFS